MSPQPSTAPHQTSAEIQMELAAELEGLRGELQHRIARNREYLRFMRDGGELTQEQQDWLATFYPDKEKGSRHTKEHLEASRKLRLEARKQHKR